MRLTSNNHQASALFTAVGANHCSVGGRGGVLIADDKPLSGGYTGDMYLKFNSVNSPAMFIFASKGVAHQLGLPVVPFGPAFPDGAIPSIPSLSNVYTEWEAPTSGNCALVTNPGDEPNEVIVTLSSDWRKLTGSSAATLTPYAHRHFYSAADWVAGVVYYEPGNENKLAGGVAATKRIPLPLSEREFWTRYAHGAMASISDGDARAALLTEVEAELALIDVDEQASVCIDMSWSAVDGEIRVGRGMGTHSVTPTGDSSSILSYADSLGLKQRTVGGNTVNIHPNIVTHTIGVIVDNGHHDNGGLFFPFYQLTGVPVRNQRVTLAISPEDPRELADLTKLVSEVFPASFVGETSPDAARVYLTEVFAGCVETSMEVLANPFVQSNPPTKPASVGRDWAPKYEDSAYKCMVRLARAVDAAAS